MPGFTIIIECATKDLLCTLCRLLLRHPVQTLCGHRCCFSCVQQKRGSSSSFICPVDGIEVAEVFPDKFIEREILNATGICENNSAGCPWNGPVKEYEDHISQCPYINVTCANQGCSELVPRKFLSQHLETECLYRKEPCQLCGEIVVVANTKKHYQTKCPRVKIKCSQCGKDILRGQLDTHQESECDEAVLACPFIKIGCTSKRPMKKNERRKHMENEQVNHNTYLLNYTLDVAQKLFEMSEEMQRGFDRQYQALDSVCSRQTVDQVQQFGESGIAMKHEPGKSRGKVVPDSTPDTADRFRQSFSSLPSEFKKSGQSVLDEILDLKSEITALSLKFQDSLTFEVQKVSRNIDAVRDSIRKMEQKFGNLEDIQQKTAINMAEQNDRIEDLENATFNGILVWSITSFTKKRHDSIVGRNVSFYSPYFYTSHYGYKMRLRIYLNGDGVGKGTHISLFFVICKGKHDALLQWPFRQKVTMSVLDQDRVKDVTDAFKPDPASSSFQRPVKEMNIASGCPLFMRLSALDTSAYSREDTLYVKAEVDLTNLPRF